MPKKQTKNKPKTSKEKVYAFTSHFTYEDNPDPVTVCIPESVIVGTICNFDHGDECIQLTLRSRKGVLYNIAVVWGEDAHKLYKLYCKLNGVKP